MEKIRRLAALLEVGIEEYETAVKTLQAERLKYLRLSMTDGFGDDENTSRMSWLTHLKTLEVSAANRLDALRQGVINAAVEIQSDAQAAKAATTPASVEPDESEDPELPSDADKV